MSHVNKYWEQEGGGALCWYFTSKNYPGMPDVDNADQYRHSIGKANAIIIAMQRYTKSLNL